MYGHMQIIRARRKKMKPSSIFFEIDAPQPVMCFWFESPERALELGLYPTVYLTNEEAGMQNDLRFVIGCTVHVSAPVLTDEVVTLTENLSAAGAKAIYCFSNIDGTLLFFEKGTWYANS